MRNTAMNGQPNRTAAVSTHSQVAHHVVVLDDGHRVGVSVVGQGVPLVFQHGVAMDRRTYLQLLTRLAESGFLVIALDAPGHGDTVPLPEPRTFSGMSALTIRALDALGIRRAVFMGHSMGGRITIELAAAHPHRALAAVLIDAAAGTTFDRKALRANAAPHTIAWGLAAALGDAALEQLTLRGRQHLRYAHLIGQTAWRTLRFPAEPLWAVRAIAAASDSSEHLRALASRGVPTVVVHARHDLIVPWQSALDMAHLAQATLREVPNASHGWILADPDRGAAVMTELRNNELRRALEGTEHTVGADSLIAADAPIHHILAGRHTSTESA